jgi:hypothetical protein
MEYAMLSFGAVLYQHAFGSARPTWEATISHLANADFEKCLMAAS